MAQNPAPGDLAEARAIIDRLSSEIEALRQQATDTHFAEELRSVLVRSALASTIAAPVSHSRLLEMIVETAAQVINSQAAALFLVDEEHQELVFEIALGQKAEEVKKFRVPMGHGIAGHVAATGQPTATSGATDPRQAREIGESVGYIPRTILCVPLFYSDRVIGVLELLDKSNDATFSAVDMHVLGLFANLAAVALEQSRTRDNLSALLGEIISEADGDMPGEQREHLLQGTQHLANAIADEPRYTHALALARLVEEISRGGERELLACQTILGAFAEYLRARAQPVGAFLEMNLRQF